MKKTILVGLFAVVATFSKAQSVQNVYVNIPDKKITLNAKYAEFSNEGAKLSGVTEVKYTENKEAVQVLGILSNFNKYGETYVIQCTAGPGYCFIWYK
ncbi:hypothetical protein [Flavobacterium sp.]|uniref:hypothetical protein n=1 Tax=Flavobacterium sp. TaxID=239 RepID=UPI002B4B191E|nr:hypothetical protein [Flavobacterium sp.]HLF52339.1 hypothetical protein [Flavobacterium sp.]